MAGAVVTTNILATTVSMGLATLRETVALVMIGNRDYESEIVAAKKNATVNVTVSAAVASRDVTPDVVAPVVTAVTPTSIPITLSQWKEAPFAMDDKGLSQVDRGILPMQAAEAAKSIANGAEDYLWSLITGLKGCYGFAGVSGTTPFGVNTGEFLDARKVGARQLMAKTNRFVVLDTDAEANALGLRAFQDASFGGGSGVILTGEIGNKLGATWVSSQRVPTHIAGTGAGYLVNNGGGYAVGVKTVTVDTGTGTLLPGDIISYDNHPQTYQVQTTVGGGTVTSITFEPGLVVAVVDNQIITKRATFVANMLIERSCLSYAMAPLLDTQQVPGATLQMIAIDEVSGLALRLEVSRQYKQTQWSFDALYGGAVIRGGSGVFIAG